MEVLRDAIDAPPQLPVGELPALEEDRGRVRERPGVRVEVRRTGSKFGTLQQGCGKRI